MKTKEEIIREAYGEYYDLVKHDINSGGWIPERLWYDTMKTPYMDYQDASTGYLRPLALKGIETNNSWTKIESESDLPKEDCNVWVMFENGEMDSQRYIHIFKNFSTHHYKHITHYQPIQKPLPPLH